MINKLPISVIILTYNEEKNIEDCLQSIYGWVEDIFIVDSYSQDSTLKIAEKYAPKINQHPFDNYSQQRNWALQNLPLTTEWIMNLDADHRISLKLKEELIFLFNNQIDLKIKGFLISRKTIFMGKWIKYGGHYPTYHAFFFRRGFGVCEDKLYDQHFVVSGEMKQLKGNVEDIITDSLTNFIERHNRWASLEASQFKLTEIQANVCIEGKMLGHPIEKRRFLRNFYGRLPLFIRPLLYFLYRYFIRLGFLDKKPGLIFHFLQGFWFRFLIDAKIYELQQSLGQNKNKKQSIKETNKGKK